MPILPFKKYLSASEYFVRREPESSDYEEAYWGEVKDPDGQVRNRMEERDKHLNNIKDELAFFRSLNPGRLLDTGCGLGFFLSGLTDAWEKFGVEVSAFAAKHAEQYGRIHTGTLEQAHYEDGFFDAVMIYHVIEHVDDPFSIIREIHRVMSPGARLVLGTPDFDCALARRFGDNFRLLHDPTHVSLFTNDSMHRFLRDHGFEIEQVGYPFFDTEYFTEENLRRLFDTSQVSPPFYGNFMTFYCRRRT